MIVEEHWLAHKNLKSDSLRENYLAMSKGKTIEIGLYWLPTSVVTSSSNDFGIWEEYFLKSCDIHNKMEKENHIKALFS